MHMCIFRSVEIIILLCFVSLSEKVRCSFLCFLYISWPVILVGKLTTFDYDDYDALMCNFSGKNNERDLGVYYVVGSFLFLSANLAASF
jgi:hypothetical protein